MRTIVLTLLIVLLSTPLVGTPPGGPNPIDIISQRIADTLAWAKAYAISEKEGAGVRGKGMGYREGAPAPCWYVISLLQEATQGFPRHCTADQQTPHKPNGLATSSLAI